MAEPEDRSLEHAEDQEKLPFTERWIVPFVREPLLWPVTAVRKELARIHRPGVVCALLGVTWVFAAVLAVVADRTGIF